MKHDMNEAKKHVREKNAQKSAAKGKPVHASSNADKEKIMFAVFNDPENTADVYDKNNNVTSYNIHDMFLEAAKPMFKEMGSDKQDLEKVKTLPIPNDLIRVATKGVEIGQRMYMDAGRKLIFPRLDEKDAIMQIYQEEKPEIEREIKFGNSSGKKVVTKQRNVLKAKNVTPKSLKYTVE